MLEEKIVINEGGKYPLNGILTLPQTDHPVPAVVFVHGSGASDMDEHIGRLTPFKDLAEGLCRYGIAAVRYDKRTYVHARKMLKEGNITIKEETIEDAVKAAELLRNDLRIDHENIFIIGHSMGGMLAPRIDAEGGNFKGLILMAGTPRRLDEVMLDQFTQIMKKGGVKGFVVKGQYEKMKEQFEKIGTLSDEEAKNIKMGGGITLYYFSEMAQHPVADYLKDTEKPILVMQGEKDFQALVDPDFRMYQELLKDHSDVVFRLYENLNHAFVMYEYDSIDAGMKEYKTERHISDSVIADIASWIMDHR